MASYYDEHISSETASSSSAQVTHWRHVRYEGDMKPWIVKEEPDRGYVAYATRSYRMGERICSEFPTVWIHGHHPFNEAQIQEIQTKVHALDAEDQSAFFAMANVFGDEFPPAVGIFMTNCFDMTDSIYGTCCAMYLALARLNHSCYPNAQQTHIPETTEEVLYAARDIAVGEEINDCYIDLRQSCSQRRQELADYYRFHCQCAACMISNEEILRKEDALRIRTNDISDTIVSLITSHTSNTKGCIAALTAALQLKNDLLEGNPTLVALLSAHASDSYSNNSSSNDDTSNDNSSDSRIITSTDPSRWCVRYLPELFISIHQLCDSLADEYGNSTNVKTQKSMQKKFLSESIVFVNQAKYLTQLLTGESSPEYYRLQEIYEEQQEKLRAITVRLKPKKTKNT